MSRRLWGWVCLPLLTHDPPTFDRIFRTPPTVNHAGKEPPGPGVRPSCVATDPFICTKLIFIAALFQRSEGAVMMS